MAAGQATAVHYPNAAR